MAFSMFFGESPLIGHVSRDFPQQVSSPTSPQTAQPMDTANDDANGKFKSPVTTMTTVASENDLEASLLSQAVKPKP